MAVAVYKPVRMSTIDTPTFIGPAPGSPSGIPDTLINPHIAWNTPSYPARSAYGPSWPKPVTEQYTSRGLISRRLSWSRPYLASTPVRKFSTSTSDFAARSRISRAPSGVEWSTVMDRLLRLVLR